MVVIEPRDLLDRLLRKYDTMLGVSVRTGISRAALNKIRDGITTNVRPVTLGKMVKALND